MSPGDGQVVTCCPVTVRLVTCRLVGDGQVVSSTRMISYLFVEHSQKSQSFDTCGSSSTNTFTSKDLSNAFDAVKNSPMSTTKEGKCNNTLMSGAESRNNALMKSGAERRNNALMKSAAERRNNAPMKSAAEH